ncbi:hypothetical protein IFR05_003417 [Cadophora sp. M221]|nr:hypothetical protein IFR05_003417 [Cadophora sp. M221]
MNTSKTLPKPILIKRLDLPDAQIPPDPFEDCEQHPPTCHVYYIDHKGEIDCASNVSFKHPNGDITGQDHRESYQISPRLTLVQLPVSSVQHLNKKAILESVNNDWRWPTKNISLGEHDIKKMPEVFKQMLNNMCAHCGCEAEILWRNLRRVDSHFNSCFRYVEDKTPPGDKRCFLKLYTLRVPVLASPLILSMVYHVRVDSTGFQGSNSAETGEKEQMFAFVAGLSSHDIEDLLTGVLNRWCDIRQDHTVDTVGITPKLFLATILSHYGTMTSRSIIQASFKLEDFDKTLERALEDQKTPKAISDSENLKKMNRALIDMTRVLTGTRSTMHYLAESADLLVNWNSDFNEYLTRRLEDWKGPGQKALADNLVAASQSLDSYREKFRDKDKLEMIRKSMQQYVVDIKAIQQHVDINAGMVRNIFAEKDRDIQGSISMNTYRDSFSMKIIAILTALLLPATVVANIMAAPMFDFTAKDHSPVLRKPFEIFWEVTASLTGLFLIVLFCLSFRESVVVLIDYFPIQSLSKRWKKSNFYDLCVQERLQRNEKKSCQNDNVDSTGSKQPKCNNSKDTRDVYDGASGFSSHSWFSKVGRTKHVDSSRV